MIAKGANQKLKLSILCKIIQEETDDEHSLTLQQIIKKLEEYDITAERKTLKMNMTRKLSKSRLKGLGFVAL
ncbi:MAG: hypothetical protein J6P79_07280 [Pseudobutyrivibrio sp.]|nr:hypothetical protein [Pseudobutyrivibrio sp.]